MRASRTAPKKLARRAMLWMLVPAVLIGSACGQFPGAHQPTFDELASKRLGARLTIPADNGENKNIPRTQRKVIEVRRVKVVNRNGPFRLCPVQARGYYSNDFGAPRFAGGYHPHQGNDMFAPLGSPIVAPFEGRAMATPNRLGGLAVKVLGAQGYVYNAHLSAYERLGEVRAGTVIGYVGNTGDALGGPPHDHFEWHPGNRGAVNPYPFLQQVCR